MREVLLAKGADVNFQDWRGQTPLLLDNDNRHEEIIKLLCKHGARD